jgi:hypothetical protein
MRYLWLITSARPLVVCFCHSTECRRPRRWRAEHHGQPTSRCKSPPHTCISCGLAAVHTMHTHTPASAASYRQAAPCLMRDTRLALLLCERQLGQSARASAAEGCCRFISPQYSVALRKGNELKLPKRTYATNMLSQNRRHVHRLRCRCVRRARCQARRKLC